MIAISPRLSRPILVCLTAVFALLLIVMPAQTASAHPTGTTGVQVTVRADSVDLEMQIHNAGFTAATGMEIGSDQAALDDIADNLLSFILNRVTVADSVSALEPTVVSEPEFKSINGEDAIVTTVRFANGNRAIEGNIVLDYRFILDVVPSHQVYVSLVSDWNNGVLTEGEPSVVGVLGGGVTEMVLDRNASTPTNGFVAVIRLGMLHIAEGTDHLLFLTTLLVVAPSVAGRGARGLRWNEPIATKRTIGRATLIITAFTAGHLVTLALVSLGLISFPTKPVEVLVAVSIIVAAIHAARPLLSRGELLIAGGFGLVHGTAFATTILELNLGFSEKLVAIIGFNIGIELAQIIAAALVLPLLIWLSHSHAYAGFRLVTASLAVVAAIAWIVGISTGQDSVLQPLFDAMAHFPVPFYLGLVAVVAALWLRTREATPNKRSIEPEYDAGHAGEHGGDAGPDRLRATLRGERGRIKLRG
ncbi:HupE/UreJ family protein [Arthrobacter sp. zg-Y20]|uniref:HupE/UreJ family protein n=1 Tax=unclassified Arthrobacter TaxID=235627 RepID=UPI001D132BD9|nr:MULTISPECIES: HupE/UreJ family protein [unclassified Arthrobacter]WIB06411.1 HupE/UreJ family protein [Arthrobacter sp. zg-Y20]